MDGEEANWWIDTDATKHMCGNRTLFTTYQIVGKGMSMVMRNFPSSQVIGKGKIELWFTSEKTVTLREVLHVPDIRKNLISGSVLSKHGFKLVFESNKFVLTKNKMFVGKGFSKSKMLKLNVINEMSSTFVYLIESCEL